MHQIDENKDSAMYNAYMGVEDIGYKHSLNNDGHRYYNAAKHRAYVSKRTHSDLGHTQSSPATYYSKHHRYSPPYTHSHDPHPNPPQSSYYPYYSQPYPSDPYYFQSDKSLSPHIMHIPSKATVPSKVPPKSNDLSPKLDDDILSSIGEITKTLNRQYSEPDAKAIRDIERDLNALPLTPPFVALGLPHNLMHAKTTPLSFGSDCKSEGVYGAVNDVYFNYENGASFDFAEFDLNSELKLIKKELIDLSASIALTEKKKAITDGNLRETNAAKDKMFSRLKVEKMVLRRSLNISCASDDEFTDSFIRSFWNKCRVDLSREISVLKTKNMAASASADVMHKHLQSQLESKKAELLSLAREREINRNKNMEFELLVIELTEMVNSLKENVDSQRHDNFLLQSKHCEYFTKNSLREYPPEIVIQENLIRAQVEFYFSDYNLKRDKRLLEKICREPRRGYLSVDEVLSLSRVRQLCNSSHHLYDALQSSLYIDMILSVDEDQKKREQSNKEDNEEKVQYHPLFIGRRQFSPPTEKQFPFRRSVYIYGLPWYSDDKYIYSMLNAFGGVTKVHFDHGPDTLDRCIMKKMLEKHRVYKLLSKDSAALTMEFSAKHSKQEQYHCYWCHKQKPCSDGYYHPKRAPGSAPSYRVCLQCAAAKAEEQSQKYDARSKLLKDDKRLRELLLGLPPRPNLQCKTALCVFASQRQASKCVYVRSRLAFDGAFATHYHHYSKLKKEIALSIKPKIKLIQQSTKPNILSVKTAPVYESKGTAVIQPHHI